MPAPGYTAGLLTDLKAGLGFHRLDAFILNDAPPLLYHRVLRDGERPRYQESLRPIAGGLKPNDYEGRERDRQTARQLFCR